jgi:hypothetical protein
MFYNDKNQSCKDQVHVIVIFHFVFLFLVKLSILFKESGEDLKKKTLETEPPDFFGDLNLDQVIDKITEDKEHYNLKPYFYTSLTSTDEILHRHEVMKDMENKILLDLIKSFAQQMLETRERLSYSDKLYNKPQKERAFIDAVEGYCDAIGSLAENLSRLN